MKVSKIALMLACAMFVLVSCKKEVAAPEEITIEYNEEVKKPIAENATIAKAKFNIEGMTCAEGCAAKIEKSLGKMDGVKEAKVDFETKTAEVSYDVDQVTTGLLAERVVKTGSMYKVENMHTVTQCTKDCKKACCSKEAKKCCDTKCSKDCTDKDCGKCAAKKAECAKKCAAKKSSCEADCKKECCANKEAKSCEPGCEKACCKKE